MAIKKRQSDPAIPLLSTYPELKTYVHTTAWIHMFIITPFSIAKKLKQPQHPSWDERINEILYIYTTEYHSAMKGNKVLAQARTRMSLESERFQTQKATCHMVPFIINVQKRQIP